MWIGVLCLIASVGCYSISQLQQHGKLRWGQNAHYSFWGEGSWRQKYKGHGTSKLEPSPNNWYYKFFKLKYAERFPLSTTFLSFLTDGYHFMQFFMFIFLSLSITFAAGFDWWLLLRIWSGIHLLHFGVYKMFQR